MEEQRVWSVVGFCRILVKNKFWSVVLILRKKSPETFRVRSFFRSERTSTDAFTEMEVVNLSMFWDFYFERPTPLWYPMDYYKVISLEFDEWTGKVELKVSVLPFVFGPLVNRVQLTPT